MGSRNSNGTNTARGINAMIGATICTRMCGLEDDRDTAYDNVARNTYVSAHALRFWPWVLMFLKVDAFAAKNHA